MTLLLTRRFLPLFATQALGALNDNLFKNALVVWVAFRPGAECGASIVALAGGLFILPYLLVSATAGQLADRFGKAWLIRLTKLAELALAGLAALAFWGGDGALLAVLFGFGVQAACFSPLKYGILPEQLAAAELLRGNALIEAGTFAAILLGTIAGGVLIGLPHGRGWVAGAVVAVAAAGLLAARAVPGTGPAAPGLRIARNPAAATLALLRRARRQRPVWVAIIGLSWFWTLGATFLAQFPVLAAREFHADNRVVTLLLASFSVGVGLGSLLVGRLGRGLAVRLVPAAGLALSLATALFVALARGGAAWVTPGAMLGTPSGAAALLSLLAISGCGGAFSVPLYARLQTEAPAAERARIVAANNVMNAVLIAGGAGVLAALAAAGVRPGAILLGTAALNASVSLWLWRALPLSVAVPAAPGDVGE